ncbi:hypothetical protein GCM10027361_38390 [Erwinia aphidicola]|jgi:hypothetical protein
MAAMYAIEVADGQYAAAMLLSKVMYAADKLHGWLKFVEIGGLYLVQPGRLTRDSSLSCYTRAISFCMVLILSVLIFFL